MNEDIVYLSPTEINKYLKYKFDSDNNLKNIYVRGELSNVRPSKTGHIYFTLKDEESKISAVMFASSARSLKFNLEDGMKVIASGYISSYYKAGEYQLYVNKISEDGIGDLYVKFEQLKKALEKEGLFDPKHKKEIPKYPSKIGVVTSPTGAAIKDIISTLGRRYPLAEIILFPSLVQGEEAKDDIVKNIKLSENYDLDVLIVGRGGGSIEDLWPFNEEVVARAIYDANVPIISAVGHERDYTISDFVADKRAETPTAAAEMVGPNKIDILELIANYKIRSLKSVNHLYKSHELALNKILKMKVLTSPLTILNFKEERYARAIDNIIHLISARTKDAKLKLIGMKSSYMLKNPYLITEKSNQRLDTLKLKLNNNFKNIYNNKRNSFLINLNKLEALSPISTLKRGYSITSINGKVLNNSSSIKLGDELDIVLYKGKIRTKVINKEDNYEI